MATSTFAPVTSRLPELCTWNTARCRTRWKPSVGWVSGSWSCCGISGVVESMNSCKSCRNLARLAPQARSTVAAASLSSGANSRCSTVMNSLRLVRASLKARFRVTSSSRFNIAFTSYPAIGLTVLLDLTKQRMLAFPCILIDLHRFGFSNIPCVHTANGSSFSMNRQHDLGGKLPVVIENPFQHLHDKVHWRVVVIEHDHFEHGWCLQLRSGFFDRQPEGVIALGRWPILIEY